METSRDKRPPIGIENFEEILTEGFYYVDKTAMIRELLNSWGKVNLFTRPRRFGKSLNMSMLKYFFEIGCDRTLFEGLAISRETRLCEKYMGRFPVISLSLKSVNGSDYATARAILCSMIGKEALRFQFLLNSDRLTASEKATYRKLIRIDPDKANLFDLPDDILMGSLRILSELLEKHYGSKVLILIDEYDVPLAKANEQGYYEEMIVLIRNMLEQALKTNDSLHFAVLSGCLRVSKESTFTGLNNPRIYSITDGACSACFGFTDDEVREMLCYYDLEDKFDTVKEWYDGYHFGNTDVYCPWDVINYVDKLRGNRTFPPQDYWINTSGNEIVRHFIEKIGDGLTRGGDRDAYRRRDGHKRDTGRADLQRTLCFNRPYLERIVYHRISDTAGDAGRKEI
uniref:AAA-ATPase-like domain-containing protein n=1 Tax=uncultured bacterium scaffold00090 TaxID=1132476 RepID=I7ARI9_9BACT|nr:hypothetical protein [uncultured bacterium scaffold00090]